MKRPSHRVVRIRLNNVTRMSTKWTQDTERKPYLRSVSGLSQSPGVSRDSDGSQRFGKLTHTVREGV